MADDPRVVGFHESARLPRLVLGALVGGGLGACALILGVLGLGLAWGMSHMGMAH